MDRKFYIRQMHGSFVKQRLVWYNEDEIPGDEQDDSIHIIAYSAIIPYSDLSTEQINDP